MRYVCLRDDDTNYFTSIDELKMGYGDLWGTVPITLATIPFEHGSERKIMDFDLDANKFQLLAEWEEGASTDELSEYHQVHPIGLNTTLVNEIKTMLNIGMIEIAQHGVTHRYNERGSEMFYDNVSYYELHSAKRYLEKVFERPVTTFIPPSNTIDYRSAHNIMKLNMNLMTSGTIKFSSGFEKTITAIKHPSLVINKLGNKKKNPVFRTFGDITYVSSATLGVSNDSNIFIANVIDSLNRYGFAAIGTHYRLLSNSNYQKKYLSTIHEIMNCDDVYFVTANDYYEKLKEIYYE